MGLGRLQPSRHILSDAGRFFPTLRISWLTPDRLGCDEDRIDPPALEAWRNGIRRRERAIDYNLAGAAFVVKKTNTEWLSDLRTTGAARESALADLRSVIMNGLPYALSTWLSPSDPAFIPLAEEVAQETLLRVQSRLDTFEGRSQFTTWVNKIAVHIALSELRRRRWKDVSLEVMMEEGEGHLAGLPVDPAPDPATAAERSDLLAQIDRLMREELTDRQRRALDAVAVRRLPMEEVARRMGTNRNALYKLIHDARLRLKRRMAEEGLMPGEVLAAFED
jgi:RNA polymerase sigma-70 factor (ECF subfamily)